MNRGCEVAIPASGATVSADRGARYCSAVSVPLSAIVTSRARLHVANACSAESRVAWGGFGYVGRPPKSQFP